jgi:hypothetical protein
MRREDTYLRGITLQITNLCSFGYTLQYIQSLTSQALKYSRVCYNKITRTSLSTMHSQLTYRACVIGSVVCSGEVSVYSLAQVIYSLVWCSDIRQNAKYSSVSFKFPFPVNGER